MPVNPQKAHYESIHDVYERHYFDSTSLAYRQRFILNPLVGSDDLSGMRIADVACGSGHNSLLLQDMFRDISLEGFDISGSACAAYSANTGAPAHEVDITRPMHGFGPFDSVIVVGGLHHCVSHIDQALANLRSMLRPGGRLYLVEPNANFALQGLRSIWYRHDRYFDANTERALQRTDLERRANSFYPVRTFYFGGPAYFFILNSLVTRVPLKVKKWMSRPLFACEAVWHDRMPNSLMAAFAAVWTRR